MSRTADTSDLKTRRIMAVKPSESDYGLHITWDDGSAAHVDLTEPIFRLKFFRPLRNRQRFRNVTVADWGWAISWGDNLDFSAEALSRLADEQSKAELTPGEFRAWLRKRGLTQQAAADLLGVSKRTIAYYSTGAQPVTRTVSLAIKGAETELNYVVQEQRRARVRKKHRDGQRPGRRPQSASSHAPSTILPTDPRYPWKRFWCARGETIILDDGGFLLDPASDTGRYANPALKAAEDLVDTPVLILLGEPGIGKSDVIRTDFQELARSAGGSDVMFENLREYSSDTLLSHRLFESETLKDWRTGSGQLVLLLDSLDEALLRIDTVAALLEGELRRLPIERLRLRIACRTAVWPHEMLEPALKELWGVKKVGVHELAPLRREDVEVAAVARGVDAAQFFAAIRAADAETFASKPLTLNMLLNLFEKEQALGNGPLDIYERGCRALCEEQSPSRRASPRRQGLTTIDRLAIASRIAAVTTLSNRFAIWTNPDRGDVPEEDVTVDELEGGTEWTNVRSIVVTRDDIMETLDTGLFTARGPGRMGWAHQAYAEFLTAYHLRNADISPLTAAKLIRHPTGGLIPQLRQVAAWLAASRSQVRREIIKADPKAMLFGDIGAMDDRDRVTLVDEYLRTLDERRDFDFDFGLRQRYAKLQHDGLADQLRPYVTDRSKNVVVRRAAIDIAEACGERTLESDLLETALDKTEDPNVRAQAVDALETCGSEAAILKLKPLAEGKVGADPDDELKGGALRLLWPKYITVEEVFAALTPPKRSNLYGSYARFLWQHLPEGLGAADLPIALGWTTEIANNGRQRRVSAYECLADRILLLVPHYIDASGVADGFAEAASARLRRRHELFDNISKEERDKFQQMLSAEPNKRRRILDALLPLLRHKRDAFSIIMGGLVRDDDLGWLTRKLVELEHSGKETEALAALIVRLFNPMDQVQLQCLYDAAEESAILRERLSWLLDAIELGSDRAVEAKELYERQKALDQKRDETRVEPPPKERIDQCLQEFEAGNMEAWWWLNLELTLKPDSRYYGSDLEMDMTAMPGWSAADESTRVRILNAAERYLRDAAPILEPLRKLNNFRQNIAGYRALALLKTEVPDMFDTVSREIWRKWAPVFVAVVGEDRDERKRIQRELVGLSYRHAAGEVIGTVEALIRSHKRSAPDQPFYFLDRLEDCWDTPELRLLLLKELTRRKLTPPQLASILEILLEHNDAEAQRWAVGRFRPTVPSDSDRRRQAVVAAKSLALYAADKAWSEIWAAVQQDAEFGKELFLAATTHFDLGGRILPHLQPTSLADMFIWLETHFPHAQDKDEDIEEARLLGPRDSLAQFRDDILRHLVQRGTSDSVNALRQCERAFPNLSWMRIQIVNAEREMRRKTWVPLKPAQVIRLTQLRESELVGSAEDLLELIFRGLDHYQQELVNQPAATAARLWNKQGDGSYRPLDENDLSDNIREFLKQRLASSGIVVNREVQVSRRPGAGIGDRTDMQVDAVRRNPDGTTLDVITVAIEAKGCWNPELKTAMRTQLVDDYMETINAAAGIYLVGWFPKAKWDETDRRRAQMPDWDVASAKRAFDMQAHAVSDETDKLVRAVVLNCGFSERR